MDEATTAFGRFVMAVCWIDALAPYLPRPFSPLTAAGTLEPDEAERDQLRVIAECRAAGFTWQGTARELARIGYVTRSCRPWTWNNVRSAFTTAARIGTVRTS